MAILIGWAIGLPCLLLYLYCCRDHSRPSGWDKLYSDHWQKLDKYNLTSFEYREDNDA